MLGLFAAAVVFAVVWARWELRVVDPLVDLGLMRERPVWTTNVAACAIGFAMFGSFVLIPQFVQTPAVAGYGFGASVTESGLFLLPSALLMLFAGPLSGRLGALYGSRVPLALGAIASGLSYALLATFHGARIDIYLSSVLLGLGVGLALRRDGQPRRRGRPARRDRRGQRRSTRSCARSAVRSAPRWPPRSSAERCRTALATRRSPASRAPSR